MCIIFSALFNGANGFSIITLLTFIIMGFDACIEYTIAWTLSSGLKNVKIDVRDIWEKTQYFPKYCTKFSPISHVYSLNPIKAIGGVIFMFYIL